MRLFVSKIQHLNKKKKIYFKTTSSFEKNTNYNSLESEFCKSFLDLWTKNNNNSKYFHYEEKIRYLKSFQNSQKTMKILRRCLR